MKRLRVLTLVARHGIAKYQGAVRDLQGLVQRTLPEADHELLVADNALAVGEAHTEEGIRVIGASNEAWEFSAWDSAIASVGDRMESFDFVHLTTSAFRQLYVKYLDRFDARMLGLACGRAAAVGHVDYYGQPEALLGMGCQAWLRTSYVFIPPAELRMLGSLVSVSEARHASLFFGDDPAAPFLANAPVSAGYRESVTNWLTGAGTGQGTEWHSRFALNADTLPFFRRKVLAIFNEQMLSNRLRAQGCAIVDATWLATVASTDRVAAGLCFPAWQEQVTGRDVDAAPGHLRVQADQ